MIEAQVKTFNIAPRCQQDLRNFTLYHKQMSDRVVVDAASQGEKFAIIHSRAVWKQLNAMQRNHAFQHLPETVQ